MPSICKKAGQLSQGAAEEDHGCRKVRVLLELPLGGANQRGSQRREGGESLPRHPPVLGTSLLPTLHTALFQKE